METLLKKIAESGTIAIIGHLNPDGDCVGSCLGLYNYITDVYPEKQADVFLEVPQKKFSLLRGYDRIRHRADAGMDSYDLVCCLDCADGSRMGRFLPVFEKAAFSYCVDHHITNAGYADCNLIQPDASSTSEIIYDLLDDGKIGTETAVCLYLGIAHDTGVFRYSCTSERTMEAAGRLMTKGIDHVEILDRTFYQKSLAQRRAFAAALSSAEITLGGKVIVSVFTWQNMKETGVEAADLDGIVSELRDTDGVDTSVFIYQTGEDEFKVSLRSRDLVDVSRIAAGHGGGGHKKAAGCNIRGTKDEILRIITEEIKEQF